MPDRKTITFVCTGNICRSPMAEYLLKHALKVESEPLKTLKIISAGTAAWQGEPQTKQAVKALTKVGIHPQHNSQPITQAIVDESIAIFCMTKTHEMAIKSQFHNLPPHVFLMRSVIPNVTPETLEIMDPYGQSLEVYEMCRDEMIEAIPHLVKFLKEILHYPSNG